MRRFDSLTLVGLMAAILALATWLGLEKGGLYTAMHEGDILHMAQIVLREAEGQWPHIDFMTPLGVLSFLPVTLFVRLGHPMGEAFILSQLLVGAVLLPAAWWAAKSRLEGVWAHVFAAGIMILAVALTPADANALISLSMSYNRWAWALAFVVLILALLSPRAPGRGASRADGVIMGLGIAALALIKVTYVVALAPVVALALLLRRDGQAFLSALVAGLAVVAVLTIAAGPAIWPAYIGDLLTVSGNDVRARPSAGFLQVVGGTATRAGTLLFLAAVILVRRAGHSTEGLLLLVAAPGLAYIAYQNYGNAPVWLFLLSIIALTLRPAATDETPGAAGQRQALTVVGWAALILVAPIFMAMGESPIRNFNADTSEAVALLPGDEGLYQTEDRMYHVQVRKTRVLDVAHHAGPEDPGPDITFLAGEPLGRCMLRTGLAGWFREISEDIAAAGLGGKPTIIADILNAYWLYGGVEPLPGGAPWKYGNAPGLAAAEAVLVPQCVADMNVRAGILDAIEEAGLEMTELRRTDDYILLGLSPKNAESTR